MIPVIDIVPENIYSHHDAPKLLGGGFSEKAAKEWLLEACRSGELDSTECRRRHWFSGRSFLIWVRDWFGAVVEPCLHGGKEVAPAAPMREDRPANPESVARQEGGPR